jgi:hypothetical protein
MKNISYHKYCFGLGGSGEECKKVERPHRPPMSAKFASVSEIPDVFAGERHAYFMVPMFTISIGVRIHPAMF